MGRRTTRRLLVGVASVAMFTAACGGDDGSSETDTSGEGGEPTGGSFSMSLGSDPEALSPTSQCYSSDCSQALSMLFGGLVSYDPETNEQILGEAESIESDDSKVWTVTLRDGLTFHNGEPVTAESYIRAWNYTANGANATQLGFFFSPVEGYDDLQLPEDAGENAQPAETQMSGLRAVDERTIEITLTEPFSQWPLTMAYVPAFAPLAKECADDPTECNEEPIGTGPYEMAEPWQHNESITMTKYADYNGPNAANADEIQFLMYSDLKTAFRDWQAGNLDLVQAVDPSQVPQAQALAGERFLSADDGSFNYFGFPFYIEEFEDPRIRQALSLAVNRQEIIDGVLNGLAIPATDVIAPFVTGSREGACEYCVYDPEQAKQLFDEAGGIDGPIEIWFNSDGGHEDWVQALAQGWKNDLGIEFTFESQPFTPYLETLTAGEVGGPYRLGWLPDYPSAENYLDPIYGEGSSNYGQWSGPERDQMLQLIAEADATADADEAVTLYQQAADIVLEELPVIPLWYGRTEIVYSENIDNVVYDPLQQILLGDITVSG